MTSFVHNGAEFRADALVFDGVAWLPVTTLGTGGGGSSEGLFNDILVVGYTRDNHGAPTSLGNYCLEHRDGYLNFSKAGGGSDQYIVSRFGGTFDGQSQEPTGSMTITGTNTALPDHFFATPMRDPSIDGDLLVVTRKYGGEDKKFNYIIAYTDDDFTAPTMEDNTVTGVPWVGDPATSWTNDWQSEHLFETGEDFYHLTQVLQDDTDWYVYHWVFTTDLGGPLRLASWARELLCAAADHSTFLRPQIASAGTPSRFYTIQAGAADDDTSRATRTMTAWDYVDDALVNLGSVALNESDTTFGVFSTRDKPNPVMFSSSGMAVRVEPTAKGYRKYHRVDAIGADFTTFGALPIPYPPATLDAAVMGVGRVSGDWLVSGYRVDNDPGATGIWASVLYYGTDGWVSKWLPLHTYLQASGVIPDTTGLIIANDDIHLHASLTSEEAVLTMSLYVGSTYYPFTILLRAVAPEEPEAT